MKLKKDEKLKLFQSHLSQYYPECRETEQGDPEALYIVEKMLETCGSERSLKITLHILRNMKQKDLTASLERDEKHSGKRGDSRAGRERKSWMTVGRKHRKGRVYHTGTVSPEVVVSSRFQPSQEPDP
ncbi:hypothetical protein SKAU_G00425350 [Synaphobranchus kaupii]|uniref:Pyrin domain-containing protein n=1 Tax=Synaphobranchus kaupii TaxID=118154 RepID=A0A9Q1IAP8_SYNKA|nr:hypothetical protein SKAU_G00425350 [Synaphobranchus kaupii]